MRTTALIPTGDELTTMLALGKHLLESGLLPAHIESPAAALAIIQKGLELRIPPMHALASIYVIGGKPSANAELMLALIYRDHGDDAIAFTQTTDQGCTITYKRRAWRERRSYSFTRAQATAAGLANENWRKYPAAMLRARCISAVARMAFPDSIAGMHTPEELGAEVDIAGDDEGTVVVVAQANEVAPSDERPALPSSTRRAVPADASPAWRRAVQEAAAALMAANQRGEHFDTPEILHGRYGKEDSRELTVEELDELRRIYTGELRYDVDPFDGTVNVRPNVPPADDDHDTLEVEDAAFEVDAVPAR